MATFRRLKVVFVLADHEGPAYHDIVVPIQFYKKYNLLEPYVVRTLVDIARPEYDDVDIICFQRQYLPEVLMYTRVLKEKGKIITTICDDNIWQLPPSNPAYPVYKGIILERYNAILREVHAVFVPNKFLHDKCIAFNKNVFINRNLVDMSIHNYVYQDKDIDDINTIRLLWHGTPHHKEDIEFVVPALHEIIRKFKNVKLIFMGYMPENILSWCPPERFEFYGFVPVHGLYPAIASLDADFAYAPLIANPFNYGKTARKAQEYAILGLPMVLSPIKTYEDWRDGVTCIKPISNTKKHWVEALTKLLTLTQDEQRELATRAYFFVEENHSADKFIFERASKYYQIWNMIKGEDLILPTDTDWPKEVGE